MVRIERLGEGETNGNGSSRIHSRVARPVLVGAGFVGVPAFARLAGRQKIAQLVELMVVPKFQAARRKKCLTYSHIGIYWDRATRCYHFRRFQRRR